MISYLKGKVIARGSDSIILLAQNIGYKVFLIEKAFSQISEGLDLEVFCYLHIKRDETIELYGVPTFSHLQVFETVRGVSGIGPKASLAISSLGTLEEFKKAIEKNDNSFFAGIQGVGIKKIQKVILELTGKIKTISKKTESAEDAEAIDALTRLGFSKQQAKSALSKTPQAESAEEKVKQALKLLR